MATRLMSRWARAPFLLAGVAAWLVSLAAPAQELSGSELVSALQEGGHVLVVRNGRSAEEPPEAGEEGPANLHLEREIDPYGQGQMAALSYAFRELDISIDRALSSPAYRSRQSAHHIGFGKRTAVDELALPAEGGDPAWLKQRVTEAPPSGQNTVIVTHGSLIQEAFGDDARNIGTGETLIYREREGNPELVARLTVEEWAKLAVD